MIHDDVSGGVAAEGVVAVLDVAAAEAQVTEHDVVRVDLGGLGAYADAIAGCGLVGDGDVGIRDCQKLLQRDNT